YCESVRARLFLLFFLLPLPPPLSPLFPYTTLFRSNLAALYLRQQRWRDAESLLLALNADSPEYAAAWLNRALYEESAEQDPAGADRKSTRLNSSHVKISYAVFCLKKKNNKEIINTP